MKYLPLVWAGIWRKPGRAVLMALQTDLRVRLVRPAAGVGVERS